ncbi:SSI family serine proteinase inhibitor [Saccharothrix sp. Mg75]|uniref:SSI family serine proteinase inhibitor n=1 Tax=Saccharothrix sp. Mg75 TaxID=3445357 RepID=UPI003EE99588
MAPLPFIAAMAALAPFVHAPESSFVLNVQRGESLRIVNLTCEPSGGLHPRADRACDALSLVDGQVAQLSPGGDAICTLEYNPVRVKATGTWRGEERWFEAEFPNPCVMHAETGPVFDF